MFKVVDGVSATVTNKSVSTNSSSKGLKKRVGQFLKGSWLKDRRAQRRNGKWGAETTDKAWDALADKSKKD